MKTVEEKVAEARAYYGKRKTEMEKYYNDLMEKRIKETTTKTEAVVKLKDGNVLYYESTYSEDVTVANTDHKTCITFLRQIHSLLGKLKDTGTRDIVDAKKGIVRVELKAVNYPSVSITYHRKLKSTDKCQIIKERPDKVKVDRRKTVAKLVCSN